MSSRSTKVGKKKPPGVKKSEGELMVDPSQTEFSCRRTAERRGGVGNRNGLEQGEEENEKHRQKVKGIYQEKGTSVAKWWGGWDNQKGQKKGKTGEKR